MHVLWCIAYYYISVHCSRQFQQLRSQAKDFIQCISGSSSLYGLQSDTTLESLVLTLLPPLGHKYKTLGEPSIVDSAIDVKVYLVQELLQSLRSCAGFHIPPVSQIMFEWGGPQKLHVHVHVHACLSLLALSRLNKLLSMGVVIVFYVLRVQC
jgi:hypothetical protein